MIRRRTAINEAGIKLVQHFESCKLEAYLDTLAQPPVWTIGWGHTGPEVREGLVWSQRKANDKLASRIAEFAQQVSDLCVVQPNDNQFAAMVSLAYNIGMGWEGKRARAGERDGFRQSTVLRLHNEGDFVGAARAFAKWNKAGGKVRAGLTRRRAAEAALYLEPVDDQVQTTRAQAEPERTQINTVTTVSAAGAVLTAAQQTVSQVSEVWDGLAGLGINPHVLLGVLGILAVLGLVYLIVQAWKERN